MDLENWYQEVMPKKDLIWFEN